MLIWKMGFLNGPSPKTNKSEYSDITYSRYWSERKKNIIDDWNRKLRKRWAYLLGDDMLRWSAEVNGKNVISTETQRERQECQYSHQVFEQPRLFLPVLSINNNMVPITPWAEMKGLEDSYNESERAWVVKRQTERK